MAAIANIFQSLVSPEAASESSNRKSTAEQPTGLFAALLDQSQPQSKSAIGAGTLTGQTNQPHSETLQSPTSGSQSEFATISGDAETIQPTNLLGHAGRDDVLPQSATTPGQDAGAPLHPDAKPALPSVTGHIPGQAADQSPAALVTGPAGRPSSGNPSVVGTAQRMDSADKTQITIPDTAGRHPSSGEATQHPVLWGKVASNAPIGSASPPESQIVQAIPASENKPALAPAQSAAHPNAKPTPQPPDGPKHPAGLERALAQVGEKRGLRGLETAIAVTGYARTGRAEPAATTGARAMQPAHVNTLALQIAHDTAALRVEYRPTSEFASSQSPLGEGIITGGRPTGQIGPSLSLAPGIARALGAPASGDGPPQILSRVDLGPMQTATIDATPGPQQRAVTTSASQALPSQLPINAIAVHVAQQARAGINRFDIRLDPPELGRLDIRLDVTRDGQATTHLIVERAETLDLLQRDARTLERALQNSGLDTSKDGLTFSLKGQNTADQGQKHGTGLPTGSNDVSDSGDAAEAGQLVDDVHVAHHSLIASDRIDIRI